MATDPFSWAKDYQQQQYALAARRMAMADDYTKGAVDQGYRQANTAQDQSNMVSNIKLRDQLDEASYDRRYPLEIGKLEAADRLRRATPYDTTAGGAAPDTFKTIADFEDFREGTYWDVNHHRVGYGSDTITDPDGKVRVVKQGDTVDRAGADRDLNRRIQQTQIKAAEKVGRDIWDKLPEGAKTALTSVSYNYGNVPDRIVPAVRTGDPTAIANAIQGLGSDNNGVNAKRRSKEAQIAVSGGGSSASVSAEPAISPAMTDLLAQSGKKPVKYFGRVSKSQLALLPDDIKKNLTPDMTAKADRFGNRPLILTSDIEGGALTPDGETVDVTKLLTQ